MHQTIPVACLALFTIFAAMVSPPAAAQSPEIKKKIAAALPDKPYAQPTTPRKLLVFTLTRGFRHGSIPVGVEALTALGRKTGAFEVVHSEDIAVFEPRSLKKFDAVCLLNTTGELFQPKNMSKLSAAERADASARDARLKHTLLEFIKSGKGLVGIHAATDCFYKWPEYGRMMGGYFNGHPWHEKVSIKVEKREHPLCQMFESDRFEIVDEIYQLREPYSRKRLNVLLSLDTERTNMKKGGIKRTDGDFAVSWARRQGTGRVFYCSLGHRDEIYWNPLVLRHYLAGIQFAIGDLDWLKPESGAAKAPDSRGFTPLFNGKDLRGWKGLVGEPKSRAAMSPAELAQAQVLADEQMNAHWSVKDGILTYDGSKAGSHLCTAADYGDFELLIDWKIEPGGDSGIYLRGSPQVQIWDAGRYAEGSGGLYNNRHLPSKPLIRADKPPGEWNTFRIKMIGKRVSVWLNDVLVTDDVILENYWNRRKPIYPRGQIELQKHDGLLQFRNIRIREIPAAEAAAALKRPNWQVLFSGRDLSGWQAKPGSWAAGQGALVRKGGGDIWTTDTYGDFILDLEFQLGEQTNSGIFFRTADIKNCVQTGIELQVLDSYGKADPGKHDCGAIYDCLAPSKNTVRKPGEWNHVVLTCKGSRIRVVMNGEQIIDMNLDDWTEPHKNPDGSRNKFSTAYKDMPRRGHIGFQDHGKPVAYRNIRIKAFNRGT